MAASSLFSQVLIQLLAAVALVLLRFAANLLCHVHTYCAKTKGGGILRSASILTEKHGRPVLTGSRNAAIFSSRNIHRERYGTVCAVRPSMLQFLDNLWFFWLPFPPGEQLILSESKAARQVLGNPLQYDKHHRLQLGEKCNINDLLVDAACTRKSSLGTANAWWPQRQWIELHCLGMCTCIPLVSLILSLLRQRRD